MYALPSQFPIVKVTTVPSSISCPTMYLNYFGIETCFMTPPNVPL